MTPYWRNEKRFSVALDLPALTQFSDLLWKWVDAPWMAYRALSAMDGRLRGPLER